MIHLPYDRPKAEIIHIMDLQQSLLVSFSAEGSFDDFEDGGEL